MSGYLSNLLTSTTDRYNSLRRTLLTSEGDGDTEDDSHICRVLRAYYAEKTPRTLPNWLPPDPKKTTAAPPPPTHLGIAIIGSSYANLWNTSASSVPAAPMNSAPASANTSRSALSDLWDAPAAAQPRTASPVSMRRQPLGSGAGVANANANVRPLPSQRAGSYQQLGGSGKREGGLSPQLGSGSSGGSLGAGTGATAQERLKARLWGQTGARGVGGGGQGYGQNQGQGGRGKWE